MIEGCSGIYRIDCPNNKFYIGSAKNISRRWIVHKRYLNRAIHANSKLQRAWNKYCSSAFSLSIIERVEDLTKLIEREQFWLDLTDACASGYNLTPTAGSLLGKRMSAESRKRMSIAHTGRKHGPMSEEQKRLISAALKGRKQPEHARVKSALSRIGRVLSAEGRAKISAALTGRPLSVEHRKKLSAAKIGRKLPESTRAAMRAAHALRLKKPLQAAA